MKVMFAGFLGGWEWVIVILAVLLLFGAKKIPELASGLGTGIKEFKKATREVTDEIQNAQTETPAKPAAPAPPAPSRADLPVSQSTASAQGLTARNFPAWPATTNRNAPRIRRKAGRSKPSSNISKISAGCSSRASSRCFWECSSASSRRTTSSASSNGR